MFKLKNNIIVNSGTRSDFYTCAVGDCENEEDLIDIVTYDEFKERGWVLTSDEYFCPPDSVEVAVCPECYKSISHEH